MPDREPCLPLLRLSEGWCPLDASHGPLKGPQRSRCLMCFLDYSFGYLPDTIQVWQETKSAHGAVYTTNCVVGFFPWTNNPEHYLRMCIDYYLNRL